ncbi:WD40-repeat-containing domain protein [Halteromyces radiatus]|uniref:WD40-repeat-containing domain protein n=1 Tax=Halteromyces radiatus TaxID=101107 RepID=UPI00221F08DE|nr:WD40-repeat-containing domain protein [Halteromyces radiatus]KAI8077812.1 WD40-repeat-containing domain protein [Halteromyces radiatus]
MQITSSANDNNGTTSTTSSNSNHSIDTRTTRSEHIKTEELLRLILQSLYDLGYQNVAEMLERDSGIVLESSIVTEFRQAVLVGNWSQCESLFPQLCLVPQQTGIDNDQQTKDDICDHARFLIRQQKFLELLEARKLMKALSVLRNELSPLGKHDTERLHELSSLILCSSAEEVKQRVNRDEQIGFPREQLLAQLQGYIDPNIMIPRDRLLTLINQAIEWQQGNCLYHNRNKATYSLFTDHTCDKTLFPTRTIAILKDHSDEVWHVAYSHCGRYLASASKDSTCIIWDMQTFQRMKRLRCASSISYCSWSPDDSKIAICGNDSLLLIWNPFEGELLQNFVGHSDQVTSCVWLPDGQHIISGSCDKSLRLWSINGDLISELEEQRIVDMAMNVNGNRLVIIGLDKKLNVYDVDGLNLTKIRDIQEEGSIASLALTKDGRYALVNIQETQEIHLWDLLGQRVIRKYQGLKQGAYIIRSTFGGDDGDETFVLSGSEDNNVYVWSREHQTLLQVLEAHSQTVNSVAWCPSVSQPPTFASASDDKTIRM